jgi:hypothetical protein
MAKDKYFEYVKPHLEAIREAKRNGATLEQIAKSLNVSYSSFNTYMGKYPELREAVSDANAELIIDLKQNLISLTKKHKLETVKKYIRKDESGKEVQYTEITTKEVDPDVAAINLLLKNIDKEWSNDPALLRLREEELKLKREMAENKIWG